MIWCVAFLVALTACQPEAPEGSEVDCSLEFQVVPFCYGGEGLTDGECWSIAIDIIASSFPMAPNSKIESSGKNKKP